MPAVHYISATCTAVSGSYAAVPRCLQRHSVEDLHHNDRGRTSRERAARVAEARDNEECTFKPALNPRSLAMASVLRRSRSGGGSGSLLDSLDAEQLTKVIPRHAVP